MPASSLPISVHEGGCADRAGAATRLCKLVTMFFGSPAYVGFVWIRIWTCFFLEGGWGGAGTLKKFFLCGSGVFVRVTYFVCRIRPRSASLADLRLVASLPHVQAGSWISLCRGAVMCCLQLGRGLHSPGRQYVNNAAG